MLNIVGIAPDMAGELVIDPYIALSFRSYDSIPYLWRIGDFKHSLLEISIEQSTGILYDITLTLLSNSRLESLQTGYEVAPWKTGLPIIETSVISWKGVGIGIWDELGDFSLLLKNDTAYVVFDSSLNPSSSIRAGRIAFFEAQGVLCGISFFHLTPNELALLKDHFTRAQQ